MQQISANFEAVEAKLASREQELIKWKATCEEQQRRLHNVESSQHHTTRATPTSSGRSDYYGMDGAATGHRSISSSNSLARFKGPSSSR